MNPTRLSLRLAYLCVILLMILEVNLSVSAITALGVSVMRPLSIAVLYLSRMASSDSFKDILGIITQVPAKPQLLM